MKIVEIKITSTAATTTTIATTLKPIFTMLVQI